MKVCLLPRIEGEDDGQGGVRRVIEGQIAGFAYRSDIELVTDEADADVIAVHIDIADAMLKRYPDKAFVVHTHGLYWDEYEWEKWCYRANERVGKSILRADAVTAPSEWVANTIRRQFGRVTTAVYHGVDLQEFRPPPPNEVGQYVWWDKTRVDPICDPEPVGEAAKLLPGTPFVTTFAPSDPPANVTVTGRVTYAKAKDLTRFAGVYLATSRETFGIATLQAMACGVPVVGFNWGGTAEIVRNGQDGYLVTPGDYRALARAIDEAFTNRAALGKSARERAADFTWDRAAEQYAQVYREALASRNTPVRTSVIVTAYNLAKYLPDTLASVQHQTDPDWECIIVDDASPDDSGKIADDWAAKDSRFRVVHNPRNEYLAGARNTGIANARGRYILPLDADDMLPPKAIEYMAGSLDHDRNVDVVYGRVKFVEEDGRTPSQYKDAHGNALEPGYSTWPIPFALGIQLRYPIEGDPRGGNCLPYASMFRRRMWEALGGYRRRLRNAEDADTWARAASFGWQPAIIDVGGTAPDTLIYRNRKDSMSRTVRYADWLRWLPWVRDRSLLPVGARGASQMASPEIASLDPPQVTVCIPVGRGHEHLVMDAIDSVLAQSMPLWEVVVGWDSPLTPRLPAWVRVVHTSAPGSGVAAARNVAAKAARARSLLWLDADDYLMPAALQTMLDARAGDEVILSDFWEDPAQAGQFTVYRTPDYDPVNITRGWPWGVTTLVRKAHWEQAGGFDENLSHWEDWAFYFRLAELGVCARRVARPIWVYRKHTGRRREPNAATHSDGMTAMLSRFGKYYEGEQVMACRSCPGGLATRTGQTQPQGVAPMSSATMLKGQDAVLIEYTGMHVGSTYTGRVSGTPYRFGTTERQKWVLRADAEHFLQRQDFAEVKDTLPAFNEPTNEPVLVAQGREDELPEEPAQASAPMARQMIRPDLGLTAPVARALVNAGVDPYTADDATLLAVKGVGQSTVDKIREALGQTVAV